MDKLVDSAVSLVEQGRLQQAVEVLQQGIALLDSTFPGSGSQLEEEHKGLSIALKEPDGTTGLGTLVVGVEVQDPHSAELGLTLYQLATTYYAHDLLTDAGPTLQRGTTLLRAHYPQDHDLIILCKHRLGMICAAGRDTRAATSLLQETKQHYESIQPQHPLAAEADLGLQLTK
eukprot:gene4688-4940_t